MKNIFILFIIGSNANFLYNDTSKCPQLNIDNELLLIYDDSRPSCLETTNFYYKSLFNTEYIFNLIKPYVPYHKQHEFSNKTENLQVFFPSAL